MEESAGTLGLAIIPPGLVSLEHAQTKHLCTSCAIGFESWMDTALTIVRDAKTIDLPVQ